MSSRRNLIGRLAAGRGWLAIAVRHLLILACWQGPFPWIHDHASFADCGEVSAYCLAEHLATHHRCGVAGVAEPMGWHVHFEMMGGPVDEPERPTSDGPDRLPAECVTGTALLAQGLRAAANDTPLASRDASMLLNVREIPRLRGEAGAQFLAEFAPHLALPVRLGTLRC